MSDEGKVGRPTTYDPAYCEVVIALGNLGASIVEMAHEIGVHRETLEENWPAANPEFSEALAHARLASQTWWERTGRSNLATQGFQSSMWSRSMAARFPHDWREKNETDLNIRGNLADIIATRRQRAAEAKDGD